jgi:FAD:protein FMN transferase
MDTSRDSVRRARPLLGTLVEISIGEPLESSVEHAIDAAFETVARVHRLMSFHEDESDVGRLNRLAQVHPIVVDPWTFKVLETALELHKRSHRSFDITVARVLQLMRLLPGPTNRDASIALAVDTADAIELLPGYHVRYRDPGIQIDLGGLAKGFAVDRAVEVLQAHGVRRGVVNAGGDLVGFGPDPHVIHVRDPRDPRRLICGIEVSDEALASSGRRFDPVHSAATSVAAIIDPSTNAPVRAIVGATVRAPSCMLADALTKVVMIKGQSAGPLLARYHANALVVRVDGVSRITQDRQGAASLAS